MLKGKGFIFSVLHLLVLSFYCWSYYIYNLYRSVIEKAKVWHFSGLLKLRNRSFTGFCPIFVQKQKKLAIWGKGPRFVRKLEKYFVTFKGPVSFKNNLLLECSYKISYASLLAYFARPSDEGQIVKTQVLLVMIYTKVVVTLT